MARTKTTQKKDKDGKHRKETRAERQARLEGQQKAREGEWSIDWQDFYL